MKVAVVTPTIGSDTLLKCVESVQNQTYGDLTHYIFYDGEEHFQKIQKQVENGDKNHPIKSVKLQENVGHGPTTLVHILGISCPPQLGVH